MSSQSAVSELSVLERRSRGLTIGEVRDRACAASLCTAGPSELSSSGVLLDANPTGNEPFFRMSALQAPIRWFNERGTATACSSSVTLPNRASSYSRSCFMYSGTGPMEGRRSRTCSQACFRVMPPCFIRYAKTTVAERLTPPRLLANAKGVIGALVLGAKGS
jgi:hypothetical protein